MYDEWLTSAHSRADDSPAFKASREQAKEGATCNRCHAPLVLLDEAPAFAAREAVSCEVCHRIEKIAVEEPLARMQLLPTHEVKFGPRCDPREPYFHRARCSPLFQQAELCAGCHQLTHTPAAGGPPLPVHTEYADFKKSVYAARGKSCQSCHMPGVKAELAMGEPERDGVPDHGFFGHAGKLRGTSLRASVEASWQPGVAELAFRLTNARAGHAIPAGSPGRELVVRISARAEGGRELAHEERTFGRRLVDTEARVVPFFKAQRVASDTRLQPGETRRDRVRFEQPGLVELQITLMFRLDPELSQQLQVQEAQTLNVSETTIELGPARRGSRSVVLRR